MLKYLLSAFYAASPAIVSHLRQQGQPFASPCNQTFGCSPGYICDELQSNPICVLPDEKIKIVRREWIIKKLNISLEGYNRSSEGYGIQQDRSGIVLPGWNIHLEANEDDLIEINAINRLEDMNTALHWHGLHQSQTNWFDGASAVTQYPIEPGQSMLYSFKASPCGTYWWHAHYKGQCIFARFCDSRS